MDERKVVLKGTGIKEAADKAVKLAESRKAAVVTHEFSKEAEDIIAEVEGKLKEEILCDQITGKR